jgi:hypothetical protein
MLSPKSRLRTSYASAGASYQMVIHYCITFPHESMESVIELCGSQFDDKLTCNTRTATLFMTTNSDFVPTAGIIFVGGMSIITECSKSASVLALEVSPEKMLVLQSENAGGVRALKKMHDKLAGKVDCRLGWSSFICKWKD